MNRQDSGLRRWGPDAAAVGLALAALGLFLALRSPSKSASDFTLFLGRFHPLAVHLPIGILLLVAFAEVLSFSPKLRPRVDPAMSIVLPVLVVTAVGSFFLGQLLASGGGFAAKLVGLHRTLTFVAVLGTALCFVLFRRSGRGAVWRGAYRAALFATVGVLSIGAHYGGSITRGDGYLTKYAPGPLRGLLGEEEKSKRKPRSGEDGEATPPSADPSVFEDVVQPILSQRCVECHGTEMMKGGLRLDSFENLQKGGDGGPALLAGNPAKSPLYSRMVLPANDDDRMPPEGEAGPSEDEIELIRWWIERGASRDLKVRDAIPPAVARSILEKKLGAAASGSVPTKPTAPPSASSVGSTQEPGASSAAASSSASADPSASATVGLDGSVWSGRVQPILGTKCGKCHGSEKQKGKLRVDSLAALLQGGKAGPSVIPKAASRSLLLSRVHLPLTNDDHMPPAKEPQMTGSETQLVAWWIDRGASADTKIVELPANLVNVFPSFQSPTPAPSPTTPKPTPSPRPTAWTPPTHTTPTGTAPATSSAATVAPDLSKLPATINLYRQIAQPVLVERCSNCHMAVSKAGELDVETLPPLLAGGDSGPAVTPGDPDKSLIIQRISLPSSDSDHMPPDGLEGPTHGEIEGVRLWIARGAKEDTVVETKALPPEVLVALELTLPKAKPDPSPMPTPVPSTSVATSAATAPPSAVATASATTTVGQSPPKALRPNAGCASCTVTPNTAPQASIWLAALACAAIVWRRGGRSALQGSAERDR